MNPAPPEAADGPRNAPAPVAPKPAVSPSRGVRGWGLALVVLALIAAGVVAWQDARQRADGLRLEVATRLATVDAELAQSRARGADLGNELRDAQAKVALQEARLAESQSQQAALETLYRDLAPSRDELALNEVEQILVLASQQLALAGNVQAALAAVQLADAKLGRMERPQWAPLRRLLARDIDALKAVPYVDVAGISAKLDQGLAVIDMLPLAKDERVPAPQREVPEATESPWLRFLRETWAEMKSLVRIEVSDRPAAPLIPPNQSYFLRENLRLRLLSGRLALLSHDGGSFRADVNAANAWLRQYFDLRTKPVEALSATLAQLAATPMPGAMPDLTRSLEVVRTQKAVGERGAGRAGVPAK
ncbi:MAG: uroporphyrinogen-III C-methyltransferase [Betaproteobacteria bacterium]